MMRLTFLGTGTSQGVPVIGCRCAVCTSTDPRDNRLRTSAMVEVDGQTIVIDTGPDFRQQMLRAAPATVDAVLYTHSHKDHVAGLDDIRPFNFRSGRAMEVYAAKDVQDALRQEYHYIFAARKYPGVPEVRLHEIAAGQSFHVGPTMVQPIEVMHYKLPVLGFRIGGLAYITDAKTISDTELNKLHGLDVLVLNALRLEPHISHFNLEEALAISRKVTPRRTYLTHISHLLGAHEGVQARLPANVYLASDGLVIEVGA